MTQHGAFCWNELATPDPEGAKAFYTTSVGWTYQAMPMPEGTYWLIMNGGDRPVGGLVDSTLGGRPPEPERWVAYLAVDDVDARCGKARTSGATILREPFDVPGVGRIAIIRQPGGAVLGWMTPASQ